MWSTHLDARSRFTGPTLRSPSRLLLASLLAAGLALTGCGGDDGPTGTPSVAEVTVTPGEATVPIDGTVEFAAVARDERGDPIPGAFVSWSTASSAVAAISSAGEAFGRASGSTTVYATVEGVRGQAQLEVVAPVPESPSDLAALPVSGGEIRLVWRDRSRVETRFEIERRDGPSGDFTALASPGTDAQEYTDLGVVPDGEYAYRIRACNDSGCSAFSEVVEAGTPPAAPTELRVVDSSASFIELSWTDNSGTETGFAVERRPSGGSWAEVARVEANGTSHTDAGLTPDTEYAYRVRACSAAGCSLASNEVTRRTGPLAAPAAPSAASAWLLTATQVVVTWSDNSNDETTFEVHRAIGTGTFSLLATTDDNVTAYSDTEIGPDTRYRYRVRACNAGGCSGFSGEGVVATAPVAPTAPSATAADETVVTVSWTDASDTETEFRIERRMEGGSYVAAGTVDADITSFVDSGLDRDTQYSYRIRACNLGGCSPYSSEVSVTTPITTPPTAPSSLVAVVEYDPKIVLYWQDNSELETSFEIERRPATGTYSLLTTLAANVETYTDETVVIETGYSYRIRACGSAGCSEYSNEISPQTPLAPPTDLAAAAASSSSVNITWTDNSSAETELRLERAPGGSGTFVASAIFILAPNTESFLDTGLAANTTYRYRIRACNGSDCSAISPEVSVTTPAP